MPYPEDFINNKCRTDREFISHKTGQNIVVDNDEEEPGNCSRFIDSILEAFRF